MGASYLTVVETVEFVRAASAAGMDDGDREALIDLLSTDPDAGTSLGGGLHKIRVARRGEGKSGGYRVLYFYREEDLPVVLLTAFAKNQKSNITAKERSELIELCGELAAHYRSR
jgi:hypothetical protein